MQISGKVHSFDPSNLPSGQGFDSVLASIASGTVVPLDLVELAYLYRDDFGRSKQLLELAMKKTASERNTDAKASVEIRITMLGLRMHHSVATEVDFFELNNVQDKRIDLLKGFYLYRQKNYEDAHFLFSKISYQFGMDLCRIAIGGKETCPVPDDPRMLCYVSSGAWGSFKEAGANKDFLFRIGKSDTPEDENNTDVRLTRIENSISSDNYNFYEAMTDLEALREAVPESPEVYYLMGKLFHLQKDYDRAREHYDMALLRNSRYMPALFNIRRINGKPVGGERKNTAVNDYNALVSLKAGAQDFDFSCCSCEIRRICSMVSKVWSRDASAAEELGEMLSSGSYVNIFDKEAVVNNLALLSRDSSEKRLELLRAALPDCSGRYEDYLRYNIGVLSGDAETLKICALPEARLRVSLLEQDTNAADPSLRGYILMNKDPDTAKALFKRQMQGNASEEQGASSYIGDPFLFAAICLGSLYLDDFLGQSDTAVLDQAVSCYNRIQKSFYGANGLAITYALRGRISEAISLFMEIADEYNAAYYNIACCQILKKDYRKALESLLKLDSLEPSVGKLVVDLCKAVKNTELTNRCIEHGFVGSDVLRKSLEAPVVPEAEKPASGGEARKRKIQEIEEARKRLNLQ